MVENKHLKDNPYRIEANDKVLEKYFIPDISRSEEENILDEFEKSHQRTKIALFIARMQPLHYGHLLVMKMALRIIDGLIIGIGSSNVINEDNPWTAKEREHMLKNAFSRVENEDLRAKVSRIVRLPDTFKNGTYDDPQWIRETVRRAKNANLVVSSNEWVIDLLKNRYGIVAPPMHNRGFYQGKVIRAELRSHSH